LLDPVLTLGGVGGVGQDAEVGFGRLRSYVAGRGEG
jgi:hypothetical protein